MPGAKATVYADGTSTLIPVYSDVAGTTPAANPIIADGDGFWPQRYVSENAKVVVTDANDVALYTLDPAPTAQGTGAAASAISFAPTIQLPQTNVQAAIEAAGALAVSGFAAFGLGVTGNAALLANLDATGTGSGIYRFDGTTTGTYPPGVAAGDTGMVELWRQSGASAMMELHHAISNRVFRRPLVSSVWQPWREVPNFTPVEQGGGTGMGTNKVRLGWRSDSLGLQLQVDDVATLGRLVRATGTPAGANDTIIVSGAPPLYACRTWVNFNGTGTPSIRAAGNVSSITDNGIGDYTINFTTAMPDANYALCGSVESTTNHPARALAISQNAVPTVSAVRIQTGLTGATSLAGRFDDCAYVSVAIFR